MNILYLLYARHCVHAFHTLHWVSLTCNFADLELGASTLFFLVIYSGLINSAVSLHQKKEIFREGECIND